MLESSGPKNMHTSCSCQRDPQHCAHAQSCTCSSHPLLDGASPHGGSEQQQSPTPLSTSPSHAHLLQLDNQGMQSIDLSVVYFGEPMPSVTHITSAPLVISPSNSATCWDRFPGEIKNRIYEVVAGDAAVMDVYDNRVYNMAAVRDRQAYLKLLPGLAYVNRQMYQEFTTVLLENRTLTIRTLADLDYLEYALNHFPSAKGWNSVKSMCFSRFSDLATSPARTNELFDFMIRCRNIEEVTLQAKLGSIHMPDGLHAHRQFTFTNGMPGIKTPEQVVANYELNKLFDLPKLRKLIIVCQWDRESPVRCTPLTMMTFWDLQDWLAQGFATHADNVKEVIKCLPFDDPRKHGAWAIRLERGRANSN